VAFFRFSRDKRGYEHFYLVEPVTNRKGKSRPRVLYWYRTPPNVRVGRAPFDDEVRRALEAQYPGVEFDWSKIVDAPIPSAEAEHWRERRRTERAERVARRSGGAGEDADGEIATGGPDSDVVERDGDSSGEPAADAAALPPTSADTSGETPASTGDAAARRRRRRRRGRGENAPRQHSVAAPADTTEMPAIDPEPQTGTPPDDSTEPSGE
jgi:hypothetical protein